MDSMREDAFAKLHPFANLLYLLLEIGIVVCCGNPILQAIALVFGGIYAALLMGRRSLRVVVGAIPLAMLVAVINPLFSHQGVTIITYFKSGNPLTLESIYYGLGMGLLVLASLVWFAIVSHIMTADRWIHIFGKMLPQMALFLSMVFRFLPKLNRMNEEMKQTPAGANPYRRLSMLLTWGLETSVDTADSMAARGYGLRTRTSFTRCHMRGADIAFMVFAGTIGGAVIAFMVTGRLVFYYYPAVYAGESSVCRVVGYVLFALLSAMPVALRVKEQIKWTVLQSNI